MALYGVTKKVPLAAVESSSQRATMVLSSTLSLNNAWTWAFEDETKKRKKNINKDNFTVDTTAFNFEQN